MFNNSNFEWDETLKSLDRTEDSDADTKDLDKLNVFEIRYYELKEVLKSLSDEDKIKLFDKIVERIKLTPQYSYDNNNLITTLPPLVRFRYIKYYDFSYAGSAYDFIAGMSEEMAYSSIKIALNNTNQNNYNVLDLFSLVPQNKKREFLLLIAEKEKELKTEIINSFEIEAYLKQFNLEERLDVLQNIIFNNFQTTYKDDFLEHEPHIRFKQNSYSNILNAFSDETNKELSQSVMFKALEFLTSESKKLKENISDQFYSIFGVGEIVKVFYENNYDYKEVIKYLAKSNAFDDNFGFALAEIVVLLPEEVRKDVITFVLDMEDSNIKVFEHNFIHSIDSLPLEETKELYIKYCLNQKRYGYLNPLRINHDPKLGMQHTSLDYLNIIFETLSPEQIESSFEEIKIAFSEILKYPKYDPKYNLIISTFTKRANLEENKVLPYVEKFGYNFLKYLDNVNIKKFVNMDSRSIEKLFALFSNNTIILNKSVINDILNSLLQRQFMLKEPEIYNIFSSFENLVQRNDKNGIRKLLEKISKEYNIEPILQKNNCTMTVLYNQIESGNLELLHEITNRYIAYKRELFASENLPNISAQLTMKKVITRESYKSEIVRHRGYLICEECRKLKDVAFTEEQKALINDEHLMWKLINFKIDPKENKLDNKYKKYLKTLSQILDILYDNKVNFDEYDPNWNQDEQIKYELVQDEISNNFLITILLESNYEGIMTLLSNETNYNSLKNFLERYKIIGWQDTFNNLMTECDITLDEETIACLISNYPKVKPLIDKSSSLTSIIDTANCYATSSKLYRSLFGAEDYTLIATNTGRNKASMSKYDRLTGCKDLIPIMYAKESFSIPTFDKKFTLSNGSSIEVIIGNATNMMNLTYGERTDACMRKGGAFNILFEHCITNKNGFHIRFVNPTTGNLISRVSGTRNGNTVFLNELRDSLDTEYSNKDLYETAKLLSQYLIQLSKDSRVPIDNIIVTSDYALTEQKGKEQSLNLTQEERTKALRGVPFNLQDKGILLASTASGGKLMPYHFTEDVPSYDSIRDSVKVYYGTSATKRMIQIRIINDVINGIPPEDINTDYNIDPPDYIISGEDYYIAYKEDMHYTFIIDSRKENPRTIAEINSVLKSNTNILSDTILKGVSR